MNNLIKEIKKQSGMQLTEGEISTDKALRAEARVNDSFAMLISSIKNIKFDTQRRFPHYGGPDSCGELEKEERMKTPDFSSLYTLAKENLKLVEDAIEEYFGDGKSSKKEDDDEEEESDNDEE